MLNIRKRKTKMRFFETCSCALFILVLVACGGGGGNSSAIDSNDTATTKITNPDTTSGQSTTTTTNETAIQSQVIAATYLEGTEQRNAYEYLNSQRQLCGFGLLQQNAKIDIAAQSHADYLINNNLQITHYEDQASYPNGFTAVLPDDRLKATGYDLAVGAGSEVIGAPNATYGTTFGQAGVMDLFLGPYHGNGMLHSDRDFGIGFSKNSFRSALVIDFAWAMQQSKQMLSANQVATYPCNGVTGVLSKSSFDESPSPISGRNLQTDPIGHPIYIKVRDGNTLILGSYALQKVGTNNNLPLYLLNKANDQAGLMVDNATAILIPLSPLETNSTYLLNATGTNNGAAISVSFTFSTGMY